MNARRRKKLGGFIVGPLTPWVGKALQKARAERKPWDERAAELVEAGADPEFAVERAIDEAMAMAKEKEKEA